MTYEINGANPNAAAVRQALNTVTQGYAKYALDASGNVTALTGPSGTDVSGQLLVKRGASPMSNRIGYKPMGMSIGHNSTLGRTFFHKLAVPVPDFYAAQLVIYHGDTTASTDVVYKAIMAATETADQSDQNTTGIKTYRPSVGATEYSTLDGTTTSYGWQSVTWAGSASQAASAASNNDNPNIYVSDVIMVKSVPRADAGEILPLIMVRINTSGTTGTTDYASQANRTLASCNGTSGQFQLTCTPGAGGSFLEALVGDFVTGTNVGAGATIQSVDSASQITVTVANSGTVSAATLTFTSPAANTAGGNKFNGGVTTSQNGGLLMQAHFAADGSGLMVSTPASNNPSSTLNGTFANFGLILYSSKAGPTLLWFGDSTVQANAISYGGLESVGLKTAAALAALGIPCGWINHGRSSGTTAQYCLSMPSAFTAWKPTLVALQTFSHNNNSVVAYTSVGALKYWSAKVGAYLGQFLALCASNKAVPLLTTGNPESAIGTSQIDAERVAWLNQIRAEAGPVFNVDTSSVVTNGASPERYAANYDFGDGIHPNYAATSAQAALLIANVRAIFGV